MKTLKAIQTRCATWLIGLVVFSCCPTLSASAAPVDETMVLKQKCTGIGGVYTVYLGKDNLRIESPALIIFAQAPKWAVTVLSPKKKIYFQSDYKSCLRHLYTARTPYSTPRDASPQKATWT